MAGAKLVLHLGILLEVGDGFARANRRARGTALLSLFANDPAYEFYPYSHELIAAAVDRYCSHSDKQWGLTDCVSFEVMQREFITDALTADVHFQQAGFRALLLEV